MCNRYTTPQELDIERAWHKGRQSPNRWWDTTVFPRGAGVFIRRARDDPGYSRELVAGQWGLIPFYAKEPRQRFPMNNARSEELLDKVSFRDVWQRGQRCIIPAASFDEPFWAPTTSPLIAANGGVSCVRMAPPGAWQGSGRNGKTARRAPCTSRTRCSPSMRMAMS